ncbi:hypothetical protein CB1_000370008 [Camelus ferus]|nr:hypothetical protein CB1_000370008 [Camelus ferus]
MFTHLPTVDPDASSGGPLVRKCVGTLGPAPTQGGCSENGEKWVDRHIENWRGLHTLNAVDMELYTGLQKLTIKNSGLRSIQPRAFAKNPHLRYM